METSSDQTQDQGYGSNLIAKANELVQASYKLTLHEQRLLLCCIAQIDSRRSAKAQLGAKGLPGFFEISIESYVATFPDCGGSKGLVKELREAADQLYVRTIKIKQRDGTTLDSRWIGVKGTRKSGAIIININDFILPYLTELAGNFTKYHLAQAADLRQVYSLRVFEMLSQYRVAGHLKIKLADLIDRLELPYARYIDVRRRVIEPAIQEITAKANMDITWKPIKTGKAVTSIEFNYSESVQGKLPFD
jgi:plasmid replication initiation protein